MKFLPVEGNRMRLDGGAMFGNCPKVLWEKWLQPDAMNRVELACRSLMLRHGDKRILFDVGIGAFFDPKMKERFGVKSKKHDLIENLNKLDLDEDDIDAVVLTHLHFDHAGGLLPPFGEEDRLLFPNAKIYVGKEHWEHAQNPPKRERASFIPKLHELLKSSGRLELIEGKSIPGLEGIHFSQVSGHTKGLLLVFIEDTRPVIVVSDLIPGLAWGNTSIAMGYDRYPELTCREKQALLDIAKQQKALLFFTHDPNVPFSEITDEGTLNEFLFDAVEIVKVWTVESLALFFL
jgi:glyoxylase-like metal-dependent hydrolase (beta-lactamase superfamily II)